MAKRVIAIVMIFFASTISWMYLGVTTHTRTTGSDERLRGEVAGLWGSPQTQSAPKITYVYTKEVKRTETLVDSRTKAATERTYTEKVDVVNDLDIESSAIDVKLGLEQRKKGLLWYSLYKVDYRGRYTAANGSYPDGRFVITFPFPVSDAVYDDFVFRVNGEQVDFSRADLNRSNCKGVVTYKLPAKRGDGLELEVGYRSQGMDSWTYRFGDGSVSAIKNFRLVMSTDFRDIDFPPGTLSATGKKRSGPGWELEWRYRNLISGYSLGMLMPAKINPGPLASSISYFAPVSLLFFFSFIFIVATIRDINIHPMNYLFLAAAFFAFHLLFSYTVDHINIYLAFGLSSFVSVFLVVSYLRLVVDGRFAATYAGVSQVVYLVLFSFAFFLEGFTGLTVTVGAILTLFVLMQMTGRVDWEARFGGSGGKTGRPGA